MRRSLSALVLVGALVAASACSGDDDDEGVSSTTIESDGEAAARFCDVYLDYLSDSTSENLTAVVEASDDPQVDEYVRIMESDADIIAVVAATVDLDDLARSRCQPEWIAGAQGAGNTGAAAQAFFDALVAGDPIGARNVASANAIAVFEPWEPLSADPEAGTPAIGDIDGQSFTIATAPAVLAECQVEAGVVVACQIAE